TLAPKPNRRTKKALAAARRIQKFQNKPLRLAIKIQKFRSRPRPAMVRTKTKKQHRPSRTKRRRRRKKLRQAKLTATIDRRLRVTSFRRKQAGRLLSRRSFHHLVEFGYVAIYQRLEPLLVRPFDLSVTISRAQICSFPTV